MSTEILNIGIYALIAFFVAFIAYGLYGYAKHVFNANLR
ncbi:hypothetical protein EV197_1434 [Aquimarina brevivitae]|uniref:Uncharacterized protein n=1 Tax=Aquimarina brevivitae TaxID=323412 RepID=A0A4Q7PIV0_9FLAO|nr:hypothetical protein EV197_1434 [Aquimarina brevivitae]